MKSPHPSALHAERYEAILQRSADMDGQFVYAVKSTGIFCRPSCPARKPRPDRVRFFETVRAAEDAGFRACKRCLPQGIPLAEVKEQQVAEACRLIERSEHLPRLDDLAKEAGMSRFHFQRLFRQITGLTPREYARGCRAERVREELRRQPSVTEAMHEAGYSSSSRFYEESDDILGMKPAAYQKKGPGEVIRFAIGQSSLGAILVASSEQGVCAILLGDDPEALVIDLQNRFSKATLEGADEDYAELVARVVGYIDTPGETLDLPLDIRGTAFQVKVWNALREVAAGETVSYSELAERVGNPKGSRAIARVCASNPIALAIPCHRVLRKDGGISDYRWGVERKRELLKREGIDVRPS